MKKIWLVISGLILLWCFGCSKQPTMDELFSNDAKWIQINGVKK